MPVRGRLPSVLRAADRASRPICGGRAEGPADARARQFVERHELANVRPLGNRGNRLWWTANITGKEEDFQKKQAAEEKLDLVPLRSPAVRRAEGHQAVRRLRSACWPGKLTSCISNILAKQVPADLLKKMLDQVERRRAGVQRLPA